MIDFGGFLVVEGQYWNGEEVSEYECNDDVDGGLDFKFVQWYEICGYEGQEICCGCYGGEEDWCVDEVE